MVGGNVGASINHPVMRPYEAAKKVYETLRDTAKQEADRYSSDQFRARMSKHIDSAAESMLGLYPFNDRNNNQNNLVPRTVAWVRKNGKDVIRTASPEDLVNTPFNGEITKRVEESQLPISFEFMAHLGAIKALHDCGVIGIKEGYPGSEPPVRYVELTKLGMKVGELLESEKFLRNLQDSQ